MGFFGHSSAGRYGQSVAAGRRTRARPLRWLLYGFGVLLLAVPLAGPIVLTSSSTLPHSLAAVGAGGESRPATRGDVAVGDWFGIDGWSAGTITGFGVPGLSPGPDAVGALSPLADPDAFDVAGVGGRLDESSAVSSLVWQSPEEARPTGVIGTLQSAEPLLVLGTVFQSLSVLRMPLTLLGGAVVWSLLLGGAFNLTLLRRHGIPFLSRRANIPLAVVLASHGQRIPAHADPGEGEVVHRFIAIDRGILGTGRISIVGDVEWTEVETPDGRGWVETLHLTEQVDLQTFIDDSAPGRLLRRLVEVLKDGGDLTDLISRHGLWVSHHADPVHYPTASLATLMTATTTRVWPGRNPAYRDTEGGFARVIGAGLLEAWDHPDRVLTTDGPAVPSTVLPVEFTNFRAVSISAALRGGDRLDQNAWLAFFSYEGGAPHLVALVKEG